jgi:hypothetical protein
MQKKIILYNLMKLIAKKVFIEDNLIKLIEIMFK